MTDTYKAAGYGDEEIGFGERPAIVVVDFQTAFTEPKYPLGGFPRIHRAVENTVSLLEVARRCGVPIAASYTAYGSEAEMPHWKVSTVRSDFLHGHPCTEVDPRILDAERDFSFCKSAASVFFNTPLATFLTRERVDTVIVTGCTTSGCVRASVVDAFSHGYRTIVVEECSGDAEEEPHLESLRDMGRRYADIRSVADVCEYLERLSRAQR